MPELTKDYLQKKRDYYNGQIMLLQGAIAALDEIEKELFPDALTLDEVAHLVGAEKAELVENES